MNNSGLGNPRRKNTTIEIPPEYKEWFESNRHIHNETYGNLMKKAILYLIKKNDPKKATSLRIKQLKEELRQEEQHLKSIEDSAPILSVPLHENLLTPERIALFDVFKEEIIKKINNRMTTKLDLKLFKIEGAFINESETVQALREYKDKLDHEAESLTNMPEEPKDIETIRSSLWRKYKSSLQYIHNAPTKSLHDTKLIHEITKEGQFGDTDEAVKWLEINYEKWEANGVV